MRMSRMLTPEEEGLCGAKEQQAGRGKERELGGGAKGGGRGGGKEPRLASATSSVAVS